MDTMVNALANPPRPRYAHMNSTAKLSYKLSFFRTAVLVIAAVALCLITIQAAFAADEIIVREVVRVEPGPPPPTFGGCFISTGKGLVQDIDCDKVPDAIDNCPIVPNPDQFDQTNNGIGDACDLIIGRVESDPPVILQGRSFIVRTLLTNYREYDMRNLRLQVEVPVLGISEHGEIGVLPVSASTEQEIVLRVPDCAYPGEYDLVFTVEYPYTAGKKEVFSNAIRVAVESSGLCPMEPTTTDKTIVDIIEIQDVDPIEGAIYPFTITNNEAYSKAYVLDVDGVEPWGTSQLEPGTLLVVPAGETRHGAVQIWANEGETGEQSFLLTVQAKDDIRQVALLADMPEPPSPYNTITVLAWSLGILVVLAIIVAIVLVIIKQANGHKNGDTHEHKKEKK